MLRISFFNFNNFQSEVVCTDDPDRSLTYSKQAEYFCSVEKWGADCYKKAQGSGHLEFKVPSSAALIKPHFTACTITLGKYGFRKYDKNCKFKKKTSFKGKIY